ncbi:hypothetical protein HanPSC8_Chr07g0305701 [Helianthus annuus]|nr:hypothetical protein HanIR_Chr07g0341161 [Helianthus annuus]KAJ0906466.1 hypothetical protein HanPSC8_Chr07g0305701 [Helianthus annuus]
MRARHPTDNRFRNHHIQRLKLSESNRPVPLVITHPYSRPAPFHLNRFLLFRFSRLQVRYAYNRTGFSLLPEPEERKTVNRVDRCAEVESRV